MRAPVASAFRWTKVHGLQMTFATVTFTELLYFLLFSSGVFYRLLPNKHNSTLTMLQLPKPPRFVILAYLKSLWLLCANS